MPYRHVGFFRHKPHQLYGNRRKCLIMNRNRKTKGGNQSQPKEVNSTQTTHEENKLKSDSIFIQYAIPIISLLVAIGAYSKDSLFVNLFKSKDAFNVILSTTLNIGPSYFYTIHTDLTQSYVVQIPVLMKVNIRNSSDVEQIIEGVEIEVKDDSGKWRLLNSINVGNGLFVPMNNELKRSQLVKMYGGALRNNLAQGIIKPRDVVIGWVYLDTPKDISLIGFLSRHFRITLYSGFGEKEVHDLEMRHMGDTNSAIRDEGVFKTDTIKDFSGLPIFRQSGAPVFPQISN